jgi:hypothetical protein
LKTDLILINGDSYSAPGQSKTYGDFLGESLGLPVCNLAMVGSNNDRIRRSTVEKIINLQTQGLTPLVIVAWSFLTRLEIWYDRDDKNIIDCVPDQVSENNPRKNRLITLDFILGQNTSSDEYKSLILHTPKIQKLLTDFYLDIYLVSMLLRNYNIPYRFFFGADHQDFPVTDFPYVEDRNFVQHCQADASIYNLDRFSISSWGIEHDPDGDRVTGHLSIDGHRQFAQWIREHLNLDQYRHRGDRS